MKTLVLGIGNTLLTDEGVGIHVIHQLQQQQPQTVDTEFLDGGTLSFTLAGDIEDSEQLIVIDATQLQAEPGTVKTFVNEDMDRFLGQQRKMSVHEVGLLDLLHISRLAERLPSRRALVGIQPESVDWGEQPTAKVAAAITLAEATMSSIPTEQLVAVLNEIESLLQTLLGTGEEGAIDLRSLPLFPGDYDMLKELLGEGEVSASLQAMGPSHIQETRVPGVWWITHCNEEGETISEYIAVTRLPSLLQTTAQDLADAPTGLQHLIAQYLETQRN